MDAIAELAKVEPIFDALWLFAPIAKDVELQFEPEVFNIIAVAAPKSDRFAATLQIARSGFAIYFVDDAALRFPGLQVSIASFYDHLIRCAQASTAFSMHLMLKSQKLALKFQEPSDTDLKPKVHLLDYSPAKEGKYQDVVRDWGNYFKIVSSELRRIIKKLPLFLHHTVCVTVSSSNSEVRFSVGSKEIVLTEEDGSVQIDGFEVEAELQVVFVPMLFFIDLTYKSKVIWFYKKPNTDCLVVIPLDDRDGVTKQQQYVIHFPQM